MAASSLGFRESSRGPLLVVRLHAHAESEFAGVERQLLSDIRRSERPLVRLGDDGGLIVFICLPEHDAYLVVGEVLAPEDLHLFISVAFGPTAAVASFDPLAVSVRHAVAFVGESLGLLLELLPSVDEHHPPAMVLRLVVSQQPDVGEDAGVVEKLVGQHDDGVEPVVLQNPAPDLALARAAVAIRER